MFANSVWWTYSALCGRSEKDTKRWALLSQTVVLPCHLRMDALLFPLTSSSNALEDELSCHRLAAGGGFGRPARYLVHYIYSEELHHLSLPAAQMLTKMS